MIFTETRLPGAYLIEPERRIDERGSFARTWCRREFEDHGLNVQWAQSSTSFNRLQGTLRGLHFQRSPHEEIKLVRCTRGRIYDVIVDLRPASPTRAAWEAFELSADNGRMLYIPQGLAHGFQSLADDSEVFYQISEFFHAESAGIVRWDDPTIGVEWPIARPILSDKDRQAAPLHGDRQRQPHGAVRGAP